MVIQREPVTQHPSRCTSNKSPKGNGIRPDPCFAPRSANSQAGRPYQRGAPPSMTLPSRKTSTAT